MMFDRFGSFARNLASTAAAFFYRAWHAPEPPQPKKQRRFVGDTGSEAAARFLSRKHLHLGCSSSLRKLQRAQRIAAGVRPLHYL